jgi:DNA-binding MarR family transcriptional regulator|tara:strand:+ start:592 stop:873 length:282 start_codon:yes stop_codon:yes gene_type:complete
MNKIYFSKRKYDVLKFIANYYRRNDYTPTFAEIAKGMGFTRSRANAIVNDLVIIGLLDKEEGSSRRKIRLNDKQLLLVNNLRINITYSTDEFR